MIGSSVSPIYIHFAQNIIYKIYIKSTNSKPVFNDFPWHFKLKYTRHSLNKVGLTSFKKV